MDGNSSVPSTAYRYSLRHSPIWNKLYEFVETRVRLWVYSDYVSIWDGQEEEVTADIVQDSFVNIYIYISQYCHSLSLEENDPISKTFLQHISTPIAYKQYQKQKKSVAHFISIRLHQPSAQGYSAIYEQIDPQEPSVQGYSTIYESVDPQEAVVTSTFEKWYCECLARAVTRIPTRLRQSLLVHLANRACLGIHPITLLQSAFIQRNICLEDYKQDLPPDDSQARKEYEASLQLACEHIMRKQKRENSEMSLENELGIAVLNPVVSAIECESEFESEFGTLIKQLKKEAPRPCPTLAFREGLRKKLLDMHLQYQISEKAANLSVATITPSAFLESAEETNDGDEEATPCHGSPSTDKANTGELTTLAAYLDRKAPVELNNPAFQEALQENLKSVPITPPTFAEVENALDATERALDQLPEEWLPARLREHLGMHHHYHDKM
jgi:DNA-directed RNA polymerase specialized sigma24 family protein